MENWTKEYDAVIVKAWTIYYCDREYAREIGGPQLGTVYAETKEEAERKAGSLFDLRGAGAWAVPR